MDEEDVIEGKTVLANKCIPTKRKPLVYEKQEVKLQPSDAK